LKAPFLTDLLSAILSTILTAVIFDNDKSGRKEIKGHKKTPGGIQQGFC
jgi:hypothetical protein